MNFQNLSNSFVEEDLFGEYSFNEPVQNDDCFEGAEKSVIKICKELQTSVSENLAEASTSEDKHQIFTNEIPKLWKSCSDILEQIKNKVNCVNNPEKITEINTSLRCCIDLLMCVSKVVQVFDKKIKFECIESLPLAVCDTLFLVYNHCKDSDTIYESRLENVSDLLTSLFKAASEIQSVFLNALNNLIIFDVRQIKEITALVGVADKLIETGMVVTSLDIKTTAELWKQLIIFLEKYSEILISRLDISIPINFFINEIITLANEVITLGKDNNLKMMEKNLKIASFNMRVVIKLCNIYGENIGNCYERSLELLITLNRYSAPYLYFLKFDTKAIDLFQTYLVVGTAPLLSHMIEDRQFIQVYFRNINSYLINDDTRLGGLFLLISIVSKLLISEQDLRKQWLRNEEDYNLIYTICSTLHKCHFELMIELPNIIPSSPGEAPRKSSLYEYLMLPTAALVLSLTSKQFVFVERLLLSCLLQPDAWKAMFAIDIWSIAARYGSAELCLTQLNALLKIYDKLKRSPDRPEKIYLSHMMANLFSFLTPTYQLEIINKFQIKKDPKIWTALNLLHYTNLQYDFKKDINNLLSVLKEKIKKFPNENFTLEEYYEMCDYLILLANCPNSELKDMLRNLTDEIIELWLLNDETDIINATWYQKFTKIKCDITISILKFFTPVQLLQILRSWDNLKNCSPEYKLFMAQVLTEVSNLKIENSAQQNSIFKIIEEQFRCILNDENPLVKQKALESFDYFAHHTDHVEILSSVVNGNPTLQEEISNYLKRTVTKSSLNDYLKYQNTLGFKHKCDVVSSIILEPKPKKAKLSSDIDIDFIVQRLCFDTATVLEFCKTNKLTQNNIDKLKIVVNNINSVM